jgi:hypothetical protein
MRPGRSWFRQDEADRVERADRPATDMIEENRRLRRESAELSGSTKVLQAAGACFAAEIVPARKMSELHRRPRVPGRSRVTGSGHPASTY